jgi:uncharacterized protein with HEPN domain
MSKQDLTARDFIGHILQAANRILDYTRGMSREQFFSDTLKQDAVIRNIEIIGEATNNLLETDPGITARYPSIPFTQMYGMRNRVAHGYFAVSLPMIQVNTDRAEPELLYHYATLDGLLGILKDQELLKRYEVKYGELVQSKVPYRNGKARFAVN